MSGQTLTSQPETGRRTEGSARISFRWHRPWLLSGALGSLHDRDSFGNDADKRHSTHWSLSPNLGRIRSYFRVTHSASNAQLQDSPHCGTQRTSPRDNPKFASQRAEVEDNQLDISTLPREEHRPSTETLDASGPSEDRHEQLEPIEHAAAFRRLFRRTLSNIDKEYTAVVERYGEYGFKAEEITATMRTHIPTVKTLLEYSPRMAFDLVMDIGEHCYGDLCFEELWSDHRVSGAAIHDYCLDRPRDETESLFEEPDHLMVNIVDARADAEPPSSKPFRLCPSRGPAATVREELEVSNQINKKRYLELHRMRRHDFLEMVQVRRRRRQNRWIADWVGNALNDLVETGSRIEQRHEKLGKLYFSQTIAKLCHLKELDLRDLYR
ncbi:hypothetical protein B0T14DRAFT_338351 [Immersiella caudata]|uniref:Uncharacterized protein n=1 Tax=Immersiella caudata TaxID=314043 RepID=A0AA39THV8_9PEZI|nr:hypothetical protein B0T14DRAFT_338351 [Immersiella caudata]